MVGGSAWVINIISVQYNGGFLPDIMLLTPRLLSLENPVKCHVVALYLQPIM